MQWEQVFQHLVAEAKAISAAPVSFVVAVLIVGSVVFLIARWSYATVITHKDARLATIEERLRLRDDQISNKFQTTSPDEAKGLIAALQEQVAKLQPRRLTDTQRSAISQAARPPDDAKWSLSLTWVGTSSDAERYAQDFSQLLSGIGWQLNSARIIGSGSEEGVFLRVPDPSNLEPRASALARALKAAEIEFDVVPIGVPFPQRAGLNLHIGFRPDQ
jgi:hypothetical protein